MVKIADSRRRVIAKLFVNFAGIIFGMLVIGPFVSGKEVTSQTFFVGILLLVVASLISVFAEPVKIKEDNDQ